MKYFCLLVLCGTLAACSSPESGSSKGEVRKPSFSYVPSQADIDYADEASPSDAALASLYDRSCISCHSVEGAGAPLTGHKADWDTRLADRGMDGLLKSTKEGKGTMPAMGMCLDCTDEDFVELIKYMSRKE